MRDLSFRKSDNFLYGIKAVYCFKYGFDNH